MDTFARSVVPGISGPNGEDIHKFDNASIQKAVDDALATLGEDRGAATIGVKADGSVHFVGAYKFGDHWSMAGVYSHTKDGHSGAIGVRVAK